MKRFLFCLSAFVVLLSCFDEFDPKYPGVKEFVEKIKAGEYDYYEKDGWGGQGELILPRFYEEQIPELLKYTADMTRLDMFPTHTLSYSSVSPFSSAWSAPIERRYILGECLLWVVEGIRNGGSYGVGYPFLVKKGEEAQKDEESSPILLSEEEILDARERYIAWWQDNRDRDWRVVNPLDGSPYDWYAGWY
ncbi:MAG: DUF4943 domain-containing protein [Tannerellaceae bacterium]|jgi:hypothetical protein|nr:DUF4943 domain-containing protein [Tannerellaceae bacterium]